MVAHSKREAILGSRNADDDEPLESNASSSEERRLFGSALLDNDADGSLSENGLREDMDARVLDAALDTEDGIIVVVQL